MKKTKQEWKRTSVLLTQEQWKEIKKLSKMRGSKKSETIRYMIEYYLTWWGYS